MGRRPRRTIVVLSAVAIGAFLDVAADSRPGQAHTCVKITSGSPPTTVLVPGDAGTCDPDHHPTCAQVPIDGVLVVCVSL
ncbi:MAG TPA: hypothetical protein VHF47_07705 [Acidimicrobiales bacterium]|nr:hypothetical protein [Acidimicrobiales bacterium]